MGRIGLALALLTAPMLLFSSCGSSTSAGGGASPTTNACGETLDDPECFTLVWDGTTRAYLLHVPTNFQSSSSALLIGLHGSQGSGAEFQTRSQLSVKADQEGFAVAYPYALVSPGAGFTEWNEFFNNSFGANPPDNVGFIRQLITTIQNSIHPDPKRIYVTGLSNGGFMTHRVGIQISDLVAAIAVVEGTVVSPGLMQNVPPPLAPVSVLMFHGDQDPTVLYCGGPVVSSQEQNFEYWSAPAADNCTVFDTTLPLCDTSGITAVYERDASGCAGNTEVKFYKLEGGVHEWYNTSMNVPDLLPYNPDFNDTTGVTTDDILWNFFASHPKP